MTLGQNKTDFKRIGIFHFLKKNSENVVFAINTLLRRSIFKSVNFMKSNMENWPNNFSLSWINYPLPLSVTSV